MDNIPETPLFTLSELIMTLCLHRTVSETTKLEIVKALKELQRWRNGETPNQILIENNRNDPIT